MAVSGLYNVITKNWSRKIDDYHRIVYKIENETVYIAYCGTHYHK